MDPSEPRAAIRARRRAAMWACFGLGALDVLLLNAAIFPRVLEASAAATPVTPAPPLAASAPSSIPATVRPAQSVQESPRGAPSDPDMRPAGSLVVLIPFESESADLGETQRRLVDALVLEMKLNDDMVVRVEGYSDQRGYPYLNQELSLKRAEAVRDRLVAAGVDEKRVRVRAMGAVNPRSDEATPEGQAENRRVEVHRMKGSR